MSPPPDSAFAKPAGCVPAPPAPPPKPDTECVDEMKNVGCDLSTFKDYKSCHSCNKDHKDDLAKVNCPKSQCDGICKDHFPKVQLI